MRLILPLALALVLVSCGRKGTNPFWKPAPEKHRVHALKADAVEVVFNPKVDILFVIDNSQSMLDNLNDVGTNIDALAKALSETTLIDYNIAVTTVWDSSRTNPKAASDQERAQDEERFAAGVDADPADHPDSLLAEFNRNQSVFLPDFANGELRPLKIQDINLTPKQKPTVVEYLNTPQRYINRRSTFPGYDPQVHQLRGEVVDPSIFLLSRTLKVDVHLFNHEFGRGGPLWEAYFAPTLYAIDPQRSPKANKGFRRDDAMFVWFSLGDANDASVIQNAHGDYVPLTPRLFKYELEESLGGADYMTFAATRVTCTDTTELEMPEAILEFIRLTNPGKDEAGQPMADSHMIDLCASRNARGAAARREAEKKLAMGLSQIGEKIRKKVLNLELKLDKIPERDIETGELKLELFYADKQIPPGPDSWKFDWVDDGYGGRAPAIVLSENIQIDTSSEGQFTVKMVPVNLGNLGNGRTQLLD